MPSTTGFFPHGSARFKRLHFGVIGIRLQSRIDAGNAAVTGDATYLYQLVMILCTNAISDTGTGIR
jgi:hypothetical protein